MVLTAHGGAVLCQLALGRSWEISVCSASFSPRMQVVEACLSHPVVPVGMCLCFFLKAHREYSCTGMLSVWSIFQVVMCSGCGVSKLQVGWLMLDWLKRTKNPNVWLCSPLQQHCPEQWGQKLQEVNDLMGTCSTGVLQILIFPVFITLLQWWSAATVCQLSVWDRCLVLVTPWFL